MMLRCVIAPHSVNNPSVHDYQILVFIEHWCSMCSTEGVTTQVPILLCHQQNGVCEPSSDTTYHSFRSTSLNRATVQAEWYRKPCLMLATSWCSPPHTSSLCSGSAPLFCPCIFLIQYLNNSRQLTSANTLLRIKKQCTCIWSLRSVLILWFFEYVI